MAKSGSMSSLQEGRKGELPMGETAGGPGDGDGSKSGSGGVKGTTTGMAKFHERPAGHAGKEFSIIADKGDGYSK